MIEPAATSELPVSPFAKRAALFALLTIPVNVVSNILTRIINNDSLAASEGPGYAVASIAYLVFVIAARLLVVGFVVYSLSSARKAFADLRTGQFSGRKRTVAAIVWGVLSLVLVAATFVSFGVQGFATSP